MRDDERRPLAAVFVAGGAAVDRLHLFRNQAPMTSWRFRFGGTSGCGDRMEHHLFTTGKP